eukprot:9996790-Alexandrium_andersonii.AAC.1
MISDGKTLFKLQKRLRPFAPQVPPVICDDDGKPLLDADQIASHWHSYLANRHNASDTSFLDLATEAAELDHQVATPLPSSQYLPGEDEIVSCFLRRHPSRGHGELGVPTAVM